jgi:hypothetical protein
MNCTNQRTNRMRASPAEYRMFKSRSMPRTDWRIVSRISWRCMASKGTAFTAPALKL